MEASQRVAMTPNRVVIASTIALSFISFWRAAAIVLSDLASSAYYVGGITEKAIGKSAPWFILAIIEVESAFRKYAVSRVGARGYMQVMPFWSELIGTTEHNLFHLRTKLRYGCVILRHYLDIERGNLTRALARYNGSLGKKSNYAAKVTAAWERWAWPVPQVTRVAHPSGPMQYAGEAK